MKFRVWFLVALLSVSEAGAGWAAGEHESDHKGLPATLKLAPAEGASVKILGPTNEQVFTRQEVPISYKLVRGKRGSHVHAYVDGKMAGMFAGNTGILRDLAPGAHTLELRVVANDHQTELDARDTVRFYVRK